jgi:hypothetical protein
MQRILCTTALLLGFVGAATAQTTSSGGQPAGNQPGTNMTNKYHNENNPGRSTMGNESRNHCGRNGAAGSNSISPGSAHDGAMGTGSGNRTDCVNAAGPRDSTTK